MLTGQFIGVELRHNETEALVPLATSNSISTGNDTAQNAQGPELTICMILAAASLDM